MNTFIQRHKHKLLSVVFLIVLGVIVGITASLSYAQEAPGDVAFDTIKQPKVVLEGPPGTTKVWLDFPIVLINNGNTSQEVAVTLNCVKSISTAMYTLQPGKNKYTHKHPLTRDEVLAVNVLKKTKGKMACDASIPEDANPTNNALTFDLYKNRVRVDIKNVKKK